MDLLYALHVIGIIGLAIAIALSLQERRKARHAASDLTAAITAYNAITERIAGKTVPTGDDNLSLWENVTRHPGR